MGLAVQTGIMEGTVLAFREINNWKFVKPIFLGDTIHIEMEILETKMMPRLGGGLIVIAADVKNQDADTIMKGTWKALIAGRPES